MPAFAGAGGRASAGQTFALGLAHVAISVVVHTAIVLAAAGFGGRLIRVAGRPWARAGMAAGLALIALWLAWEIAA
ncbi:hypothetical protein [Brevundimonas balnearis]|uniref:GDT1 family protein n=1 Tax=Brevundimonas balnearis TaxID=1572858 RepID=A0ABV6R7F4_9CAUL